MTNPFDVLIYLDDVLVKDLSSLVLTGYIETVTLTQQFDKTLAAGIQLDDRVEKSDQGSVTKFEKEGFTDRSKVCADNESEQHYFQRDMDGKQYFKEERQIKTTFTAFALNGSLMDYFTTNNHLHHKDEIDIQNNNIDVGDLIEIEGTITNQSLLMYIDTLINLIEIFGTDTLDEIVKKNKCSCNINFSMFLKMLKYLEGILGCNNTQDLIMKTGDGGCAILTVSKSNFMNNQCNVFDKINCHCKVVGKVIETCSDEFDSISLLRKTGQEEFFESFFEKTKCLIECLKKNDIMIPKCPPLRIDSSAIQIMPLGIYV